MTSTAYIQAIKPNQQVIELGLDRSSGHYFWNLYALAADDGDVLSVCPEPIAGQRVATRGQMVSILDSYAEEGPLRDALLDRVVLDLDFDTVPGALCPPEQDQGDAVEGTGTEAG